MNNNMDMAKLMNMLSNMDKKDLQKGVEQLNQILKNNENNNVQQASNKYKK